MFSCKLCILGLMAVVTVSGCALTNGEPKIDPSVWLLTQPGSAHADQVNSFHTSSDYSPPACP